ncbi:MAG: response regulator [Planctomycetota bacterium]
MTASPRRRLLVVDDTRAIHDDYRKVLAPPDAGTAELDRLAADLFGAAPQSAAASARGAWEFTSAFQGEEAVELCRAALAESAPFQLAFVDMRMPPGWDGLRTIQELWRLDPRIEVVLCTAYSDRTHAEITAALGDTDRLLILKKPFDTVEVVQLVRSLGTKWDLEREREVRIAALSGTLEERNRELAARLEELARANRGLEAAAVETARANKARDEFLTNVTHELRTPLTSILGFAELIEEAESAPELGQHARTIRTNGEHLLCLVNDLLDLSRLEAGAMPIERLECSPRDLVRDVGDLLAPRARAKGLRLVCRCEDGVPARVYTDPTRVRQILFNLAGNAIKFTLSGGVDLVVRAGADAFEMEVRDTGIGLSPEQRDRLFVPFSQAEASTARRFGGTGLGLSITRRLVELLGGTITLESELGAGSTFRVRLPLVQPPEAPAAPLPAGAPASSPSQLAGARILVIDDARDVQRLVRTFLERAGASVDARSDGKTGLAGALGAQGELDLVLLDMMMPEMDGYEVARRLRATGFEVPVIALTAHAQTGDEQVCLAAGCDAFLTKPIDRTRLIAECARLIQARREALAARSTLS